MKFFRHKVLFTKLSCQKTFQSGGHLSTGLIWIFWPRTVKHMLTIAHTLLWRLIIAAESSCIFKIIYASLIFSIAHGAWIGGIAVSGKWSICFWFDFEVIRSSFTSTSSYILMSWFRSEYWIYNVFILNFYSVEFDGFYNIKLTEQRWMLQVLLITHTGMATSFTIQYWIIIQLFSFKVLCCTCHQR